MFATPKRSALLSWLLHCGAILLILAVTGAKTPLVPLIHEVLVAPSDLVEYKSPVKLIGSAGGGGGGGVHADTPASRGQLPRFAAQQLVPPVVRIDNATPILPVEPTLIGDSIVKPASYDNWGDPNSMWSKLSGGRGSHGGIGEGDGTGVGPGKGPGHGPGEDGNEGGGKVGYLGGTMGSVTAPTVISKVEPEYSDDARKARLQGTVLLQIVVDAHGTAQNITVSRSLGLGLDDRAVDAVKKWRFLAGKVNGKAAAMVAYVEVNFRLL